MAESKTDSKNDISEALTNDPKNVQELTVYVQTLLQNMQDKFQTMSDEIITRIDEMSNRINDLERNVVEITNQAGIEASEINK